MEEVIICLGNVFYTPKTIEDMRLRAEKSVEIYKRKNRKIIFTGGFKTRKDLSEAKFMLNIALKMGVRRKDVILEEKANTTIGNAVYCKKIMEKKGFKSAVVVTAPHHLRRAKYIFKKVMPCKKLSFERCKSNLGFFESIRYYFGERYTLLKLKIKGIDFSEV